MEYFINTWMKRVGFALPIILKHILAHGGVIANNAFPHDLMDRVSGQINHTYVWSDQITCFELS